MVGRRDGCIAVQRACYRYSLVVTFFSLFALCGGRAEVFTEIGLLTKKGDCLGLFGWKIWDNKLIGFQQFLIN